MSQVAQVKTTGYGPVSANSRKHSKKSSGHTSPSPSVKSTVNKKTGMGYYAKPSQEGATSTGSAQQFSPQAQLPAASALAGAAAQPQLSDQQSQAGWSAPPRPQDRRSNAGRSDISDISMTSSQRKLREAEERKYQMEIAVAEAELARQQELAKAQGNIDRLRVEHARRMLSHAQEDAERDDQDSVELDQRDDPQKL